MALNTPRAAKVAGGWLGICVAFTGGFEAYKTHAYKDPIGVVTVCAGETRGVRMGDIYTMAQCREMLATRLLEFDQGVRSCVPGVIPDPTRAAFVSLAYNIGVRGFCKSSTARLWNAGEKAAACTAMLKFNRAGGIVFKGLTRRREAERVLCMEGV